MVIVGFVASLVEFPLKLIIPLDFGSPLVVVVVLVLVLLLFVVIASDLLFLLLLLLLLFSCEISFAASEIGPGLFLIKEFSMEKLNPS